MDRTEELAYNYLKKAGFDPIYEPLGLSTCPDFEINEFTAIEVRRLNENDFNGETPKGLNTSSRKITDSIEGVLRELIQDNPQKNYWVSLEFKRPLIKPRKLKKRLKKHLENTLNKQVVPTDIIIENLIKVTFHPKHEVDKQIFHLGTFMDLDRGGWVLENLCVNINYCIEEKTAKIIKTKKSYTSCWLILVDEISYGEINEIEKKHLFEHLKINPIWDKLILIDAIKGKEILKT